MMLIIQFLLITLVPPVLSEVTYQLIIPKSDGFPYAKLLSTIDRPLEDYTLCHWSKYKGDNYWGTVLFYNTADLSLVLRSMLTNNGKYNFVHSKMFQAIIESGQNNVHWLHTCVSVTTVLKGNWTVFFNGIEAKAQKENKDEYPIPPNGLVVLGQYSLSKEGEFAGSNKFRGQIADVYMWDRTLSPQEISEVYRCSNTEDANVINWKLHTWQLFNGARISSVKLPCGKK